MSDARRRELIAIRRNVAQHDAKLYAYCLKVGVIILYSLCFCVASLFWLVLEFDTGCERIVWFSEKERICKIVLFRKSIVLVIIILVVGAKLASADR